MRRVPGRWRGGRGGRGRERGQSGSATSMGNNSFNFSAGLEQHRVAQRLAVCVPFVHWSGTTLNGMACIHHFSTCICCKIIRKLRESNKTLHLGDRTKATVIISSASNDVLEWILRVD